MDSEELNENSNSLSNVESEFPFPFDAYDIQREFMKNLYHTLDHSKFGIFESPTGTGKSLSLVCGILKWYYDHKKANVENIENEVSALELRKDEKVSDDWIEQQSHELKMRNQIDTLKDALKSRKLHEEQIENIRKENEKRKKALKNDRQVKVHALTYRNRADKGKKSDENTEDLKEIDEMNKEFDDFLKEKSEDKDMLLDDVDCLVTEADDATDDISEKYSDLKIYFCSRTHSQLSQFVKEINKTIYKDRLRITSLSSRQNYCINDSVNRLKNINLINEKCIELSRNSKKTKTDENNRTVKKQKSGNCRCPYKNEESVEMLRNEILSNIHDIEEIVLESKSLKACPYYASRSAVKLAQMIVLPYNLLLHKSTREMSNIDLKDSVVVIDEAHNLLDMIENIHSSQLSADAIYHGYNQIQNYKNKFLSKFNAHNLLHINQIVFLLKMFLSALNRKHLIEKKKISIKDMKKRSLESGQSSSGESANPSPPSGPNREESKLSTLSDFLMENNIDNINVFKLLEFIKQSKLCYKLQNYSIKYRDCLQPISQENVEEKPKLSGLQTFLKSVQEISNPSPKMEEVTEKTEVQEDHVRNPMLSVVTFLESLVNRNEDGRILVAKSPELNKSYIKYILLNPANHFSDIVAQARSIIVAGGTMEPVSEFKDQLFGSLGVPESRIHHFSCGHVIPADNILPLILTSGPTNQKFDLTFEHRTKSETLKEISMTIANLCNIVPKGMVCFFPSYDYEAIVFKYMTENLFIERIAKKKSVFREPKKSSDVDKVLSDYAKSVEKPGGGALLLSVIGGKLSEGLNFSDDLGRCVVVVGMPYANIKSLYIREKMKHLDSHLSPGAGQLYYRNSCMKGVNQSIGRAIRHANDYACMILIDARYSAPNVQELLPGWIRNQLTVHHSFGPLFKSVNAFFQCKKSI